MNCDIYRGIVTFNRDIMETVLKIQGNIYIQMRQCGYYFERQDKGELAFCRIIGTSKSGYPRFHAYIKTNNVSQETPHQNKFGTGQAIINLHLDQKRPVYKGAPAHGAEYEGKIVEKEAARIKQILGL